MSYTPWKVACSQMVNWVGSLNHSNFDAPRFCHRLSTGLKIDLAARAERRRHNIYFGLQGHVANAAPVLESSDTITYFWHVLFWKVGTESTFYTVYLQLTDSRFPTGKKISGNNSGYFSSCFPAINLVPIMNATELPPKTPMYVFLIEERDLTYVLTVGNVGCPLMATSQKRQLSWNVLRYSLHLHTAQKLTNLHYLPTKFNWILFCSMCCAIYESCLQCYSWTSWLATRFHVCAGHFTHFQQCATFGWGSEMQEDCFKSQESQTFSG